VTDTAQTPRQRLWLRLHFEKNLLQHDRAIMEAALAEIDRLTAERDAMAMDAARLDWFEHQSEAYGFEQELHGYKWEISGPFATLRVAIDAAMKEQP